nr:MAG TPA: hypothetical protein [Caudoviricetes sp.]
MYTSSPFSWPRGVFVTVIRATSKYRASFNERAGHQK